MYTVEVYKSDARTRKGLRLVHKQDHDTQDLSQLQEAMNQAWPPPRFRTVIHETYVTRTNLMTGQPVQERYDLPWSCSVASESYWSS